MAGIKLTGLDLLTDIPDNALIYVVSGGNSYRTTKALFLAGFSGEVPSLQQVCDIAATSNIPIVVLDMEDGSKGIQIGGVGVSVFDLNTGQSSNLGYGYISIGDLSENGNYGANIGAKNLTERPGQVDVLKLELPDADPFMEHTIATETYVDAGLATKLDASAYEDRYKGKYTSLANLQAAVPVGQDGWTAIVDAGLGVTAKEYIWDAEEGWVISGSVGASTTDALPEGSSNLYFQAARVLATVLSGFSAAAGTVTSSDSILVAINKIVANIALKANIASPTFTGTVTTPEIIVSSETASRIAIFDATKKLISADTSTYPSLAEFALLKGVNLSIQPQLNNKSKRVFLDATQTTPVTAGSGFIILATGFVPANTLNASDSFPCQGQIIKSGGANTATLRLYHNTTNSLTGATQIATFSLGASSVFSYIKRDFTISGGNLIGYLFTTTASVEPTTATNGISTTPFNVAVDNYFFLAVSSAGSTDTFSNVLFKGF